MTANAFGRGAYVAAMALALGLTSLAPARADVNGYISASNTYDNNVFRQPSGENFSGVERSDDITFLNGGGVFDLRGNSYTLTASGDVGETFFLKNSFLNAPTYTGAVDFEYHQKIIDIDLEATVNEQLSSFGDIREPIRNLQSSTRVGGRFGVAITNDIKVIADAKYFRNTDSNALISQADYNESEFGLGIGYFSPAGNSIILEDLQSDTKGINDQPFAVGDETVLGRIDYSDNTISAQLKYSPDPLFGLYVQGGYLNRTDKSILHNNIQTPVAVARFVYQPDANLSAVLSLGRQLSSQSYLLISEVKDNYVKFSPTLMFENGMQFTIDVNDDQRQIGYAPEIGFAEGLSDKTLHYDATVSYLILQRLSLSLTGYHEERHSNQALDTYNANGVMIMLKLQNSLPPVRDPLPENSDFLLFQ